MIPQSTRLLIAASGLALLVGGCRPAPPDVAEAPGGVADANTAPPADASRPAPAPPAHTAGAKNTKAIPDTHVAPNSAQAAAQLVQSYFALIDAGRYAQARALYGGGGDRSGKTAAEFAADYRRYREYHAGLGVPGPVEGAAGSLYVAVPVEVYGRLADGTPFRQKGAVNVRRVNGSIPGATAEQRRWHIEDIALGEGGEP
jgi:hypothetical protein